LIIKSELSQGLFKPIETEKALDRGLEIYFWPLIYAANKAQIKNPNLIFPGQKLINPKIPKR